MIPISENAYFGKVYSKATVLFFLCFIYLSKSVLAQENKISKYRVSISVNNVPFQEVLTNIESQIPFKFAYGTELIQGQKKISLSISDVSLPDFLTILLHDTYLSYSFVGNEIVLQNIVLPAKITLSGYIKDSRTGESLIGSSIYIPSLGVGTITNNYGFYSLTIPYADSAQVEISYVGYKSQVKKIIAHSNLTIPFILEHNYEKEEINNLIISKDKRDDNVTKNQTALIQMSSEMIVGSPSISGNGDVMTSLQMLPGVQAGLDGSPGYYVRGGNSGQNLILLDEATLYNPSHLFGFVGIFNTPAIQHADLMKGGFPACYGDEISSVLDVAIKDGSNQQLGGGLQLGTISSGLTFYGPFKPGKSSFLFSARRSMVDLILHPIFNQNYFTNYYFYDVNGKLNFQLTNKDHLFLSLYAGRDNNDYSIDSSSTGGINYYMHFGNTAFTLRWNHQYSAKIFSNTSLIYNQYHQFLSATQEGYFAQLYSGIRDINAKTDLTFYPSPRHKINTGVNYLYQILYPASLSEKIAATDSTHGINPDNIPPQTSTRLAVYLSDNIMLNRRFNAYLGIRVPFYQKYEASYLYVEPRISLLYMLNAGTSVKVSYSEMHQYIHLVQSFNSSFPAEIWIGSSQVVLPQSSREISGGLYRNFNKNVFQTSLEFYYREMKNQLLFKGVTAPVISNNIENDLIFGKGWSYGAEFYIRKNRGKLTGWLAYSLSYANQQFDSLNLGNAFPLAYDRRHLLDISLAYAFTAHWKIAANLFVASGRAFTLNSLSASSGSNPGSNPLYDEENNNNPGGGSSTVEANNYRLTPYNRLDLSLIYSKSRSIGRIQLETEWILSVYNVYARQNTSFAYRTIDPSTKQVIANQVSFIPIIPSLTYSVKF